MSKRNQMKLLRQCAILFARKKVCNEESIIEWLRIVFAAHRLGYLYCGFDEGGDIDVACIAYRIMNLRNETRKDLPAKERGTILYVNSVASKSNDNLKLFRLMKWYLKKNLEIDLMAYDYRNRDSLHVYEVRRQDGKIKKTKLSRSS